MHEEFGFLSLALESNLSDFKMGSACHSYLVSCLLSKGNISHTRSLGYVLVKSTQQVYVPHFWNVISVGDTEWIIDFNLPPSSVFDEETPEAPFGVFNKGQYSEYEYVATEVQNKPYDKQLFNDLTGDGFSEAKLPQYLCDAVNHEICLAQSLYW